MLGIAFSPDGNQFAFIRNYPSQGLGTLSIARADGTNARTVANRRAPDYFNSGAGLSWSPDGKVIACVAVNASDGYQRVFEVNIETGAQKPLTSQKWDGGISGVAWLSDSSGLLLSAGGQIWLWRVSQSEQGGNARTAAGFESGGSARRRGLLRRAV